MNASVCSMLDTADTIESAAMEFGTGSLYWRANLYLADSQFPQQQQQVQPEVLFEYWLYKKC